MSKSASKTPAHVNLLTADLIVLYWLRNDLGGRQTICLRISHVFRVIFWLTHFWMKCHKLERGRRQVWPKRFFNSLSSSPWCCMQGCLMRSCHSAAANAQVPLRRSHCNEVTFWSACFQNPFRFILNHSSLQIYHFLHEPWIFRERAVDPVIHATIKPLHKRIKVLHVEARNV